MEDGLIDRFRKRWRTMETWTKVFFVATSLNFLLLAFFALFPLVSVIVAADQSVDIYVLTKTALLCTLLVFQMVHSYAGLILDNIYEVYAMILTQAVVSFVIAFLTLFRNSSSATPFEYGILAYAVVLQLFFFVVAYPLHREHRWSFYRKVGVDPIFRHMYSAYLRFKAVLKVDFMIVLLNLLCISSVPLKSQWLITLFVTGLLLAAGFFAVGMIGFRRESTALAVPFYLIIILNPAISALCVYVMSPTNVWKNIERNDIHTIFAFMYILTAAILIITRLSLLIVSIISFQNFGLGLRGFDGIRRQPDDFRRYSSSGESDISDTEISVRDVIYATTYDSI